MVKCAVTHKCAPWGDLSCSSFCFKVPTSWPVCPGHYPFHSQKWRQQAFFLEKQNYFQTTVSLNYMWKQLLLCSYLCIIRIGPIKNLVSLYFLVILPPLPSDLLLLSSVSFWPDVCSELQTDGSSTSLKGRAGHPEESLCQCLEMWSLQGLLLHYFPLRGLGVPCSVPASSNSLELGWDASSLFCSPFGVLSLDLEHSSAMFPCHVPTRQYNKFSRACW